MSPVVLRARSVQPESGDLDQTMSCHPDDTDPVNAASFGPDVPDARDGRHQSRGQICTGQPQSEAVVLVLNGVDGVECVRMGNKGDSGASRPAKQQRLNTPSLAPDPDVSKSRHDACIESGWWTRDVGTQADAPDVEEPSACRDPQAELVLASFASAIGSCSTHSFALMLLVT
ncbi:unnamed protein product [Protopolystoma xenopodis]|uniref:Uncharacterized protein n=1 Tax=Protopolystoma xenopodis TaxID=117903 RepID=A0A448XGA0_9PLAT|nr:unnamed protein product [Protopolystoma xenopodis]